MKGRDELTGIIITTIGCFVLLVTISVVIVSYIVTYKLTHPPRRKLHINPSKYGLTWDYVTFQSRIDFVPLSGWFIKSHSSTSTVILAHGYSSNRVEKNGFALNLARDLVDAGYNVFMFDFRNSGMSGGTISSVGYWEQRDLGGAIDWVKSRCRGPIFLHGFSMGAATVLLVAAQETNVNAVVADSSFDNLDAYLMSNLSKWSKLPKFPFNRIIISIIPLIVKASASDVTPVDALPKLSHVPILFIHGMNDQTIPWQCSQQMHNKSSSHSQLWLVPNVDHVGAYLARPEEYARRVTEFLGQAVSTPGAMFRNG
ncbi:MAG: alpha/beta hydrolase [Alicyclobacillus sp.]|nr:alpha/beta hydrolase [Alicyclobacillus sp.]